jgi:hypothetical protein
VSLSKKKAVEPKILVMGDKEREDKNRSTTGASRPRLDLGASKLGNRNSSMKQKQISKREFSMNDMMS